MQIYDQLKSQGALDEQRIYETALDLLAEQRQKSQPEAVEEQLQLEDPNRSTLLSDFQEADHQKRQQQQEQQQKSQQSKSSKVKQQGVNISSLFKD